MIIKPIEQENRTEAVTLVLSVFMEFEAPEYSEKGIHSFQEFVRNHEEINTLDMYGAYHHGKLVGVIATRKHGNHISLFFVDKAYHGKGIGRELFQAVVRANTSGTITVNSSPYAVSIYQHLGFVCTDTEQIIDGIRYTPMIFQVKKGAGSL